MTTKAELRASMLSLRDSFTVDTISEASNHLAQQLATCSPLMTARTIMTYAPYGSELDPNRFMAFSHSGLFSIDSPRLVYPRVVDDTTMAALTCDPSDLVEGYRGIAEPPHNAVACNLSDIDVVLVPGIAFDESGYRIGYGKGYYDRFLHGLIEQSSSTRLDASSDTSATSNTVYRPALLGITWEETIVENALPDAHDIRVDYLITPQRIIVCSTAS